MAGGKEKKKYHSSPQRENERRQKKETRKRRKRTYNYLLVAVVAVVLLVGVAVALSAYNETQEDLYDLSVVGGGIPVVVQVHDPSCPYCVELRGNVESIQNEYDDDDLLIRFAELRSDEGAAFARKHGADRVTLLFFNGEGELRARQVGVQSTNQLRRTFTRHAAGEI